MEDNSMKAEIDLYKNAIYAVVNGQLIQVDKPPKGYGQQTFHWEQGNVTRIVHNHIQKL